mgnify:FL=1
MESTYTFFQRKYGEPGITPGELANALSEAGVKNRSHYKIQRYAEQTKLLIDLGEGRKHPQARYLIKLSDVQTVVKGLSTPISTQDLENIIANQQNEWQNLHAKEIKRRKTAI